MLAPIVGAVRADIDRQVGWVRDQVRRQTRYTALTGILAGAAVLAAVGATVVGLIALHSWLATQTGPFIAHAMIGGGLLLLALILLTLTFVWRRPQVAARPPLQAVRPAALLATLRSNGSSKIVPGTEQTLKLATDTLRDGPRSAMLATLALAVAVGLIVGRSL